PIGVFIHHNTLHAFQHLPFHEGVQAGAAALGARPYLSLREFRAALALGRVAETDVRLEVDRLLGANGADMILPGLSRAALWTHLTVSDADTDDAAALHFLLRAGTAAPCHDQDRARWAACEARVARGPRPTPPDERHPQRHRDLLVAHGQPDPDIAVHGELIRLSSGFLDQGQAQVQAPYRAAGFLRAVAESYVDGASPPRACRGVELDMRAVFAAGEAPADIIRRVLVALGVTGDDVEPFLLATALALPGWSGMFARLERHPEEHPDGGPVSLAEFLAVRLLLEQRALTHACAAAGLPLDWPSLRRQLPPEAPRDPVLDALLLWSLAGRAELSADAIHALSDDTLAALWHECLACSALTRRQLFMEAYERSYRTVILDAVAARRALPHGDPAERPRAQFVFCIDEREESIRRALEEQHPGYITFGTAGFFGVAIDYMGLDDHAPAAHCPVVVTPAHEVHEQPVYTAMGRHALRQRSRERWLGWERRAAVASRTLSGGAGLSFLLGPVSGLTTLARVAAPRSSLQWGQRLVSRLAPVPATRLSAMRVDDRARITDSGKPVGFSLAESIDRVTAVLTNIGIVRDFAPIIVFLGHGSTSLNNPHESAHDCGACGGRRGGANARLFADMANRPDVRDGVRQRGIDIPADTWFVGALHDTASDSVRYYDLDALPPTLGAAFEEAYAALELARREDALERCRRFDDAPLDLSPEAALRHVEARSSHLAQPRPEYGHCTNAICIVGRRALTRGLHLDRRAFLVSYDPTIDPHDAILERILAAVGPVGAGISLEYYFSSVDNETFGCGTKLPHNVTGLIGVMNGHQSDLRTGLPRQMVEIHEPMRLLLIVDATPEALLGVASRQAEVAELVTRQWIQLVSAHPETGAMQLFQDGGFVPYVPQPMLLPVVERSPEWHMQSRVHLAPALVRSALPLAAVGPGHHHT
ncbi:MAG: DUF2309 domain-containing protein, partial [Gemmatimonadota bacterium]|nr:DUF2309 domain-containing protein [Gemmatimonadota bacterium]